MIIVIIFFSLLGIFLFYKGIVLKDFIILGCGFIVLLSCINLDRQYEKNIAVKNSKEIKGDSIRTDSISLAMLIYER